MIDRKPGESISYQGLLGDINFGKHLIQLKGDDKVVVHKGHAINFAETVTILKGSFNGRGYEYIPKTNGYILSTNGLFKWISSQTENETLKFFTDHLELKYIHSTIFKDSGLDTDFSGVSVSLVNYSFN